MDYDVIGDVHGHADKLESLLANMGYQDMDGAWRHPTRMALFVGDFVDRGPRQIDTIRIVRAMVDAGSALAVMGNHELNAIAWVTPDKRYPGEYLRKRTGEKGRSNHHHHKEFLEQVGEGSELHLELVSWFMTLPLWIDLPEMKVAHACWHPKAIEAASAKIGPKGLLTQDVLQEALGTPSEPAIAGSPLSLFDAIELVCKGVEIELPPGESYADQDGFSRTRVRSRWWDGDATTFRACALMRADLRHALPDTPIPDESKIALPTDKPVFFGHYWMRGEPKTLGSMAACVDYSAARDGPLVAYRFSGESELSEANFASSGSVPKPGLKA